MKRLILILAIGTFATTLAIQVFASDDPTLPVDSGPAPASIDSEFVHPVSPLGQTIESIQQQAQAKLQELNILLTNSTPGSSEAMELQSQAQQVKVDAEVAILDAIIKDA